eukprot:gene9420-biopygen16726
MSSGSSLAFQRLSRSAHLLPPPTQPQRKNSTTSTLALDVVREEEGVLRRCRRRCNWLRQTGHPPRYSTRTFSNLPPVLVPTELGWSTLQRSGRVPDRVGQYRTVRPKFQWVAESPKGGVQNASTVFTDSRTRFS